ncbi:MAG: winged helix-turn-helix transcriptional regulator [Pseudomonadota bacterium]
MHGQLEHAGLITRRAAETGRGHIYELTDAGRDLDPIIMALAGWGQKWARDMETEDLDPAFLAWSMHTRLNIDAMPPGRTVMEFEFTGTHKGFSRFWLVVDDGNVDMCLKHPGYDPDVIVSSDLRQFIEAWRGFRDLRDEISAGHIRLAGSASARKALPEWLLMSGLAKLPRLRGREAQIAVPDGARSSFS